MKHSQIVIGFQFSENVVEFSLSLLYVIERYLLQSLEIPFFCKKIHQWMDFSRIF